MTRRRDRCPIGDTAIRAHDERGIQLPTTNRWWRVAKSRVRTRIRLMKRDSLLYVVAGSLYMCLRLYLFTVLRTLPSPWWIKSSVGFVVCRCQSSHSNRMNIVYYCVTARCINLEKKTILLPRTCCNVVIDSVRYNLSSKEP